MAGQSSSDYRELLAPRIRLPENVEDIKTAYKSARPFPHVILDNLFHEESLNPLLSEIAGMADNQWVTFDRNPRERTLRMRSAAEMQQASLHILSIVHSVPFLLFLSEITGVQRLLPDPYLQGGGFAAMRRGHFFDVHADQSIEFGTGLTRRLAMIIFLNKSWKREYHGELELWSADGERCEVSVDPLFNRTILFEVAFPNYHGVPAPLACPSDRMRQSFLVYYHTTERVQADQARPKAHTTIFAPRVFGTPMAAIKTIVREVTPPFLVRLARKLIE